MRRHYYAKITTVDEKLGQILDGPREEMGYLENSLLIFSAPTTANCSAITGWPTSGLVHDPIVHVPMIVRDGRRVAEVGGQHTEDLASLMDLGPTL